MLFGQLIKQTRTARGWMLRELAARAQVSEGYISLVERDKKNPRIGNAIRLARALKMNIGVLAEVDEIIMPAGFVKDIKNDEQKSKSQRSNNSKKLSTTGAKGRPTR